MRIITAVLLSALVASPAPAATPGYGGRSQIGQLIRQLDSLGPLKTGFVQRQPLIKKLIAFLRPGLSVKDDVKRLESVVKNVEDFFGEPVSSLQHPALKDGPRMRVEKAMALVRYGRRPSEVTEEFIRTQATIEGTTLDPRDIFVQRWRPIGTPSGKMVVVGPGFPQTGRSYYEQIQLLNKQGHEVVVFDQQWSGYTAGPEGVKKGGIDSAEGIARDYADVAAYANGILEKEYGDHPKKQLILTGTSMGGGSGVVGALRMYDSLNQKGERVLKLGPGQSIPANRAWVAVSAFFGATNSRVNRALGLLDKIPWVRNWPLPLLGLPILNRDRLTNTKLADHAAAEDVRSRAQALSAALPGLQRIMTLVNKDGAPAGRGMFLHSEKDDLADPELVKGLARKLGSTVRLKLIPGHNHLFDETAGQQQHLVDAIAALTKD